MTKLMYVWFPGNANSSLDPPRHNKDIKFGTTAAMYDITHYIALPVLTDNKRAINRMVVC